MPPPSPDRVKLHSFRARFVFYVYGNKCIVKLQIGHLYMVTVCLHFYLMTICSFLGILVFSVFGPLFTAPIVVRIVL